MLALATPFVADSLYRVAVSPGLGANTEIQPTNETQAPVPTKLAEIALSQVPDLVVPVHELTGLDLPDLRLADLKRLPLPDSVPLPDLSPDEASRPVNPEELPPDLADRLGATVKEITQDTPFSMVALTGSDLSATAARIRAELPDGSWGPWEALDVIDGQPEGAQAGTEPVYVGQTTAVQVLSTTTTPGAGNVDPAAQLSAVTMQPQVTEADATVADIAEPVDGGPKVVSRSKWGADESIRCSSPDYDEFVSGATVHHTAGNNAYTKAEAPGIVRAIYTYHASTLHWCDVGYNALVDKFGTIYEGRAGGLDKPVEGAHAGGFNMNTVGIAMMGNYDKVAPSEATIQSVGRFLGWRLKLAGADPGGTTTMYSEGSKYTPFAEGKSVRLPVIFAHRDVGNTECPGDAAYAKLDEIRAIAAGTDASTAREDLATDSPSRTPSSPEKAAIDAARAELPDLMQALVDVADDTPIARQWVAEGGPYGRLGPALTGILAASNGAQYAKFTNGYVYSLPSGKVVTVMGEILQKFLAMGLDAGDLGLPQTNEYPVPDGMQADFERGSIVVNEVTGFANTVLTAYNGAYWDSYGG